jgi:hypothetical protein
MRWLIRALLGASVVGAVHAIRLRRPARFAAIPLPGSAAVHAATIGSPLSAPPLMLAALVIAERRGRPDVIAVLSGLFVVGILGEVDTWHAVRAPGADPVATACVVAYVLIPAALVATARSASLAS